MKIRTAANYVFSSPSRLRPVDPLRTHFESFNGQSYSDHPRAIFEELTQAPSQQIMSSWALSNAGPENTKTVRPDSVPHFSALQRAGTIVSNGHLPGYYRKRTQTRVLQTWHGTPLKRIGFDLNDAKGRTRYSTYIDGLAADVAKWDALLSTSPFVTRVLRQAFQFDGPVLEFGSPRNDALARATPEDRLKARRDLGVEDSRKVLLYAPTFRDGDLDRWLPSAALEMARSLPDPWVVVSRLHPLHQQQTDSSPSNLIDGQKVDDITQLFLAADALVTDYSSLMFDFMITRKPVVLFCPDLEIYQEDLRGFYLDIAVDAPGPVFQAWDDAANYLLTESTDFVRLERTINAFAPWDDGLAASRVVSWLSRTSGDRRP